MELGFLGLDWKNKKVTLFNDGKVKFNATNVDNIGRATVAALENPEYSKNKLLKIHDFYLTQREILAIVEEKLGKFEVAQNFDGPTVEKENWARFLKGERGMDVLYPLIQATVFGANGASSWDPETDDSRALRLPPQDLRETVLRVIETVQAPATH